MLLSYFFILPNNGSWELGVNNVCSRWEEARRCALLSVDAIMEEVRHNLDEEVLTLRIIYWERIKKEIQNYKPIKV